MSLDIFGKLHELSPLLILYLFFSSKICLDLLISRMFVWHFLIIIYNFFNIFLNLFYQDFFNDTITIIIRVFSFRLLLFPVSYLSSLSSDFIEHHVIQCISRLANRICHVLIFLNVLFFKIFFSLYYLNNFLLL